MEDDIQNFTEFLLRVEASASARACSWSPSSPPAAAGSHDLPFPEVKGWNREKSVVDLEPGIMVRYAVYSKIIKQQVTGEGPDVDSIADASSELETELEGLINDAISYEKRVYMISHPIAVWHSGAE